LLDSIKKEDIEKYSKDFEADPKNLLALNAVTRGDSTEVALSRDAVTRIDHTYSHMIKTGTVTAQGNTGRCWMFAGLNMFRIYVMKKLNLDDFELSQPYLMFYDKLEKGNWFLEKIIETREMKLNSRVVMWLLNNIIPDAGQWDMFANLVNKYGIVPKKTMPETKSSMASRTMNLNLQVKLREYAKDLRNMYQMGHSIEELREAKHEMLNEYYRILRIHLGTPPTSFTLEWRDRDDQYHREGPLTPQEFYQNYVGLDLDRYVCLINAPTSDKPYNSMYTVKYLGNVVGGKPVRYLNVPAETMIEAAKQMVTTSIPVWFGADAGKARNRKLGVFDTDIYDHDTLYGTTYRLDKAERLDYGYSKMTHAMVFTGVNLDTEGNPNRWRVENSWGIEPGDKGFYTMTTSWFKEYLYEVLVDQEYLPEELLPVLETEPIELDPWDPMGALA
jgi:bleomycin hydrolase